MAAGKEEVVLLGAWASGFVQRVRIALVEKGVEYEYREQNLGNKSEELLQANPVYKKVPILIHNGKSICESRVIIEYIDEVWPHIVPLLPSDPYRRARARFWADFIDKKVYDAGLKLWKLKGDQHQAEARKEFFDAMAPLETALDDKNYFGGETFGFVDAVLVSYTGWFHVYETYGGFSIEKEFPRIGAWAKRCKERASVTRTFPDEQKVSELALFLRKHLGIDE